MPQNCHTIGLAGYPTRAGESIGAVVVILNVCAIVVNVTCHNAPETMLNTCPCQPKKSFFLINFMLDKRNFF